MVGTSWWSLYISDMGQFTWRESSEFMESQEVHRRITTFGVPSDWPLWEENRGVLSDFDPMLAYDFQPLLSGGNVDQLSLDELEQKRKPYLYGNALAFEEALFSLYCREIVWPRGQMDHVMFQVILSIGRQDNEAVLADFKRLIEHNRRTALPYAFISERTQVLASEAGDVKSE